MIAGFLSLDKSLISLACYKITLEQTYVIPWFLLQEPTLPSGLIPLQEM
jgi:hypothetical protein